MKPNFPKGTITSFAPNTPYFFLSNFYPSIIEYDGITYPTVEHAYQAMKTENLVDRTEISNLPTPARAKYYGKSLILRPDWDEIKYSIMNGLLRRKFSKGSLLERQLYQTGSVPLVEGNWWHDIYWGQCTCPRHKWAGSNMLGGLLMDIRLDIKENEAWTTTEAVVE